MGTTNDEMFVELSALYPTGGTTLGDLLHTHWSTVGLQYRGSLQFQYYKNLGAVGTTLGDAANEFWSDHDFLIFNLEQEDGTDLLLEDSNYILMEASN
jgi:hypothetical protein